MKNINKDKDFLMFSGVVFFMVLIGFLWILSVRNNFQIIKVKSNDNAQIKSDMDYIGDQLNHNLDKMNGQFEKINQVLENGNNKRGTDIDVNKASEDDKSGE